MAAFDGKPPRSHAEMLADLDRLIADAPSDKLRMELVRLRSELSTLKAAAVFPRPKKRAWYGRASTKLRFNYYVVP